MRIKTKCNKCGHEAFTWIWSNDRVELARTKGDFIELKCKNCNNSGKYHVDTMIAFPNKLAIVSAILIFLSGIPILLYFLWDYIWGNTNYIYAILVLILPVIIPSIVYGIVMKNDRNRVSIFNRHKINNNKQLPSQK